MGRADVLQIIVPEGGLVVPLSKMGCNLKMVTNILKNYECFYEFKPYNHHPVTCLGSQLNLNSIMNPARGCLLSDKRWFVFSGLKRRPAPSLSG